MIMTRSPLRITLGGGGTDLPSYCEKHGGFSIVAAIDKYVFVNVNKPFYPGIFIKYSKMEQVKWIYQIQHPIIRESLKILGFQDDLQIDIGSFADIPAGTGLGSSSSFTTGLLLALSAYMKNILSPEDLACAACKVEIDLLKEPIGKQDQYAAACGGITALTFNPDGTVKSEPLKLSDETLFALEDNLLLFFTGITRNAKDSILQEKDDELSLDYRKEIGFLSRRILESGNLDAFASYLREHWLWKKRRSPNVTSPQIDEWYELGMKSGALGGKLVGAGGGGFLMFYAKDPLRLRKAMTLAGLSEMRFRFDFQGTRVIL
jgi:D-glycero-alpha-D-manno-heptose-7-phosphate kinase